MRFVTSLLIVLAMVASVQADTLVLSEDFEGGFPGTLVGGYNGWVSDNSTMVISSTTIDVGNSAAGGAEAGSWDNVRKAFSYSPGVGEWYELTATMSPGSSSHTEIDLSDGGAYYPAYRVSYDTTGAGYLNFGRTDATSGWTWLSNNGNPYADAAIDVKMVVKATGDEGYYRLHGETDWVPIAAPSIGSLSFSQDLSVNDYVVLRPQEGAGMIDSIHLVATIPEPSTIALLACGLVSLLAYAWRKRR